MALTFTKDYSEVHGRLRVWVGEITYDASYLDNGETIAASDFDLDLIKDVILDNAFSETDDLAMTALWDNTASKIRLFHSAGDGDPQDEAESTFDASNYTSRIRVYGW